MKTAYLAGLVLFLQLSASPLAHAECHDDGPIITCEVKGEFDNVSSSLKFAITNQGLVISGTSRLQEMLDRTAADLGYEPGKYLKAESFEFCSADLAHKMFLSDRRNVATCPMTIAAYVLPDSPEIVRLSFRKPILAVKDEPLEKEIRALFEKIVDEATAW